MIRNDKLKFINIFLWIASIAVTFGIYILWELFFENGGEVAFALQCVVIAVTMLVFLFLISGKKTFSKMGNELWYSIRVLWPILVFSGFFGLAGVIFQIREGKPLNPNVLKDLGLFTVQMLMVGLYEETCFRACAADAMLPVFKKLKHPFLLTALISSLAFGYVHVPVFDTGNFQQIIQFVLKIVTTGLFGATLMLVYYKSRNLLAIAIIHFLNDFLPSFMGIIFPDGKVDAETYTTGDVATTIVYIAQMAVFLWALIRVYKEVWPKIDAKKTAEEW